MVTGTKPIIEGIEDMHCSPSEPLKLRASILTALVHGITVEVGVCVSPTGKLPTRSYQEAGGWDLYADLKNGDVYSPHSGTCIIQPNEVVAISSGVRIDFPTDCMALLDIRSSLGKQGLDVLCRTIDSDYRGVIGLILKAGKQGVCIKHGEKIAQLIFNPYTSNLVMVECSESELSKTERGSRGFGSSGKF